ncbi:hypothetical protein B0H11DRAFT_1898321 [Mycena galericulata]|nr:hypothetical protein B0H11DRAFT_1898321 [Mycena galericulata]
MSVRPAQGTETAGRRRHGKQEPGWYYEAQTACDEREQQAAGRGSGRWGGAAGGSVEAAGRGVGEVGAGGSARRSEGCAGSGEAAGGSGGAAGGSFGRRGGSVGAAGGGEAGMQAPRVGWGGQRAGASGQRAGASGQQTGRSGDASITSGIRWQMRGKKRGHKWSRQAGQLRADSGNQGTRPSYEARPEDRAVVVRGNSPAPHPNDEREVHRTPAKPFQAPGWQCTSSQYQMQFLVGGPGRDPAAGGTATRLMCRANDAAAHQEKTG